MALVVLLGARLRDNLVAGRQREVSALTGFEYQRVLARLHDQLCTGAIGDLEVHHLAFEHRPRSRRRSRQWPRVSCLSRQTSRIFNALSFDATA